MSRRAKKKWDGILDNSSSNLNSTLNADAEKETESVLPKGNILIPRCFHFYSRFLCIICPDKICQAHIKAFKMIQDYAQFSNLLRPRFLAVFRNFNDRHVHKITEIEARIRK